LPASLARIIPLAKQKAHTAAVRFVNHLPSPLPILPSVIRRSPHGSRSVHKPPSIAASNPALRHTEQIDKWLMTIDHLLMSLENRIAVVTGAGRGIGAAIAHELAAAGAKVAIVSRTEANSVKSADAINAEFPDAAKAYAVDVADFAAVQEIGKQIIADFGGVDIIVNNAGVTRDGLFLRMKEEDWDTVIDTNLKGAFNIVKAFSKPILKSKAGRIINIASVIGLIGNAGQTNYAASKAGLIGMTKSFAKEFASRAVTANAVCPGFVVTDMTGELTDDMQEQIKSNIPLKCFGDVKDIANVVRFIASDEARYITGQAIAVDGGMVM